MKISEKKYNKLSDVMLNRIRNIDDILGIKGWNSFSTSGMRMLTDDLLNEILNILNIQIKKDD